MKKLFLLLSCIIATTTVLRSQKTMQPDNRLIEAFGADKVSFWQVNFPDSIEFYNFIVQEATEFITVPEEKMWTVTAFPDFILKPDFKNQKQDFSNKGLESINVLMYDFKLGYQYKLGNTNKMIYFIPNVEELLAKRKKYAKQTDLKNIEDTRVDSCQHFSVDIISNFISTQEATYESPYFYFNTCAGTTNTLTATGVYYENGHHGYTQTDETTKFYWTLSSTAGYISDSTQTININFNTFAGWNLTLLAKDNHGCFSELKTARVRVASSPIKNIISNLPDICPGDTVQLCVGYSAGSDIQIDILEADTNTAIVIVDPTFIPDICSSSAPQSYTSTATYDIFTQGAVLTSSADFVRVYANLEHSYIGDLDIKLTCPSGQQVQLKAQTGGGVFFGEPTSCSGAVDNCSNPCSSPNPLTLECGVCYHYSWAPTSTWGDLHATQNSTTPSTWLNSLNNNLPVVSNTIRHIIPNRDYMPSSGNWNNFIGCPLNGDWVITITDHLAADNGWICEWGIELNPQLLPESWSFSVALDSLLSHDQFLSVKGDTCFVLTGSSPNFQHPHHFAIVDEFGCVWDSIFILTTVDTVRPTIIAPDHYCDETSITLSPLSLNQIQATYLWHTTDQYDSTTNPTIVITDSGTYIIEMWGIYNSNGLICRTSDTVRVDKWNAIHMDPVWIGFSGCVPLNILFPNDSYLSFDGHRVSSNEIIYYHWKILDEFDQIYFESNLRNPTLNITDVGNYSVFLDLVTEHDCTDGLGSILSINVYPQPVVEFVAMPAEDSAGIDRQLAIPNNQLLVAPVVVTLPNAAVLFKNVSDSSFLFSNTDIITLKWDFGDGTVEENSTVVSPVHVYSDWGDYTVRFYLETDKGCTAKSAHQVIVEKELEFPNVITPNGDGYNDVFAIKGLDVNIHDDDIYKYRTNFLKIYDRWGRLVYSAENYNTYMNNNNELIIGDKVWDGANLSDGVYYFTFTYRSYRKDNTFHGQVSILRGKNDK